MSKTGYAYDSIDYIEDFIKNKSYSVIIVVADKNTYCKGGDLLEGILSRTTAEITKLVYESDHPLPDEYAAGRLMMALPPAVTAYFGGLLIALGSGTVTDLCRFVASKTGFDFVCVPTAASMDGYASSVAAMVMNRQKETFPAVAPLEIFADYRIYKTAPQSMNSAGFGDVIGKFTSLTDWQLGNIVTGEAYDESIAKMTRSAVNTCLDVAEGIKESDESALKAQMDALILSGTAMKLAKNSRPASGAEHHIAHYYEAASLRNGETPKLHGACVSLGAWVVLRIHELLLEYGQKAASSPAVADVYREKWSEIQDLLIKNSPDKRRLKGLCELLESPLRPDDLGLDKNIFIKSVLEAMYIRPRYTVLRLCDDLGLLKFFAEKITGEFF